MVIETVTSTLTIEWMGSNPILSSMYNLFLDDIRTPSNVANYILPNNLRPQYLKETWVIVRNYEEFVNVIAANGMPAKISFDHDLADIHYDPETWTEGFEYHEKTGLDCAKFIIELLLDTGKNIPEVIVHSQNPVGAERILNLFDNYCKHINH